jgi:hypothetical protein
MGNKKEDKSAASAPERSKANSSSSSNGFTLGQEPIVGIEPEVAKYEVAPEPPIAPEAAPSPSTPEYEDLGELPSTYHADTLFCTARDPRWLFCYWDFDWTKVPRGAFQYGVPMYFLRISRVNGANEATVEIKPEARNWYVPVSSPATAYVAEIGYTNNEGTFVTCVSSGAASTPPEGLAEEQPPAFATVPTRFSFDQILQLVKDQMAEGESLLQAVARITNDGVIAFRAGQAPTWSDEQRRILAALVGGAMIDQMGLGSAQIDELLRKSIMERLHSENASGFAAVWQRALYAPFAESSLFSGVTSWSVGASWSAQPFSVLQERGFFMHVNAEIIFYGGTHPDAAVTIDGKPIQLNPDGTFRYHFRLPDGDWRIPIVAESPDKVEQRSATLSFQRGTSRTGEVDDTPQPSELAAQPMGRQ